MNEFFNVTEDLNAVDLSLPTLIVGWELTKSYFPEQNILNTKIDSKLFWTFSKREKRSQFERDFGDYVKFAMKNMGENVNYHFFNYIIAPQNKQESFINYLNKGGNYCYYNSRFLYIYNPNDKMTFGISLVDLHYVGIYPKDFIKTVSCDGKNFMTGNLNFLSQDSFNLLKDNVKSAAYLYFLRNS